MVRIDYRSKEAAVVVAGGTAFFYHSPESDVAPEYLVFGSGVTAELM